MTILTLVATHSRRLASLGATATALAALATLAGCAPPFANYSISSANVANLRSAQRVVQLGDFIGTQATVSCRLRRIGPSGDRTFSQYVRAAFNDELVIAGPAPSRDAAELSLWLKEVSVDCGNLWASWTLVAEVQIAGRPPFPVKVSRSFEASVFADQVQKHAGESFAPTVQKLIAEVIASPAFKEEFGGRR